MAKNGDGEKDKDLASFLNKAKKAKPERPLFFALVLKGGSDGKLMIDRKKVAGADIAAAKKEIGGSAVVRGVCFGEGGVIVFETAKPPVPAWKSVARKLAKEDAGLAINAEFRAGRDVDTLPDSFPEGPEEAEPGEALPAAEQDPARAKAKAAAAAWQQRVEAVTARVKAAAAAGQPEAKALALGVSQAGALFRGGHAEQAEAKLTAVEDALAAAGGAVPQAPPGTDQASPKPDELAAQFK